MSHCIFFGFPADKLYSDDAPVSYADGKVGNEEGTKYMSNSAFTVIAPISEGYSGGPIISKEDGALLGLVTQADNRSESHRFGVRTEALQKMMKNYNISINSNTLDSEIIEYYKPLVKKVTCHYDG